MQNLQSSRIPHLAHSLLYKRAAPQQRLRQAFRTCNTTTTTTQHVYNTHRQASTAMKRFTRRRPTPSQAYPSNTPIPTPTYQAPQRPLPAWLRRLFISQSGYFWGASVFGVVVAAYLTMTYISYVRAAERSKTLDLAQNADVSSRWQDLSRDFDDEVEMSEKLARLHKKRARLCSQAYGNVLEVSCGTGRNLRFYDLRPLRMPKEMRIRSLVFNDQSEIMVYQAQKKYDKLLEEAEPINRYKGPVKFVVGDGGDRRVISRPEGGFDVIVQTMGICSMSNPVEFLKRLGTLARQPGEKSTGIVTGDSAAAAEESTEAVTGPDFGAVPVDQAEDTTMDKGGKILLLEHGRSTLEFVNGYMDEIAKEHADRYGCWFNKDIESVVNASGLVVESMTRSSFGTVYEYVLRPAPAVKVGDHDHNHNHDQEKKK
ncbi:hypothetical protein LTR84_002815 [Exophiala bonariae]|uniref:Methyltransferase domain-containing protein n=1 Tax=Exophiala bonariae TaxID=1690606 RepID=A0AAV9N8N7_9EURO|nr:hypothetical protein LTR84_002815 [Exophiala bonariae]